MTNPIERVDAWEADGRRLLQELEAEHDAVSARIEQQREYRGEIQAKIKRVKTALGLVTDAPTDGGPPKGYRRREIAAVPVERLPTAPTTPAPASLTTPPNGVMSLTPKMQAVFDAVRLGPAVVTEITARVRRHDFAFEARGIGGLLNGLRHAGLIDCKPSEDPNEERLIWFVPGNG